MTRRVSHRSPIKRPSRAMTAVLLVAIAAVGFTTLLMRLAVTREGYQIAALSEEIARLQNTNRSLKLQSAELSAHSRLRALAPQFDLQPPQPRQVVMMP